MTLLLGGLALLLALLGLVLYLGARWWQRRLGLAFGRVVLADMPGPFPGRTLYDPDLNLVGRPDYIIALDDHVWVPLEVKSGQTPPQPHPGHIHQVVAYALLIRRVLGKQVPFALLHYPATTFRIEVTPQQEAAVLALLERMHTYRRGNHPPGRSHTSPARCARCGFRAYCAYRLDTREGGT